MSNATLSELGPVDYVVVEFPAGATNFTGEMAEELLALVDAGTIRVIDILILTKNGDGSIDVAELSDLDDLGPLVGIEAELAEPTLYADGGARATQLGKEQADLRAQLENAELDLLALYEAA